MNIIYSIKNQIELSQNIKKLNDNIRNDELWLGRFYIKRQKPFSSCLVFIDKKTQRHMWENNSLLSWNFLFGHKIWRSMNDFIIHSCKVWEEEPRPSTKNAVDYRKVKVKI
jgi:hypothetical protein